MIPAIQNVFRETAGEVLGYASAKGFGVAITMLRIFGHSLIIQTIRQPLPQVRQLNMSLLRSVLRTPGQFGLDNKLAAVLPVVGKNTFRTLLETSTRLL